MHAEKTPTPREETERLVPPSGLLDSQHRDYYSFHPEGTPSLRSIFSVVSTMAGAGVVSLIIFNSCDSSIQ